MGTGRFPTDCARALSWFLPKRRILPSLSLHANFYEYHIFWLFLYPMYTRYQSFHTAHEMVIVNAYCYYKSQSNYLVKKTKLIEGNYIPTIVQLELNDILFFVVSIKNPTKSFLLFWHYKILCQFKTCALFFQEQ